MFGHIDHWATNQQNLEETLHRFFLLYVENNDQIVLGMLTQHPDILTFSLWVLLAEIFVQRPSKLQPVA